MSFRAGVVAVIGRPNVGKSSIVNKIVGEKVSVVSSKPQTTRKPAEGIANFPGGQIVFRDTAGIHQPKTTLGKATVDLAFQALHDADVVLWVVDVSQSPDDADEKLASAIFAESDENVGKAQPKVVVALNKMDRLRAENVELHYHEYEKLSRNAPMMYTNGMTSENTDKLAQIIIGALPEGPPYFDDPAMYTTQSLQSLAGELIRESVLHHTKEEIPHAVAVLIEEWRDPAPGKDSTFINATIFVERESQRPILLGHNGSMIKTIGTDARKEIERLIGGKVFLELRIKVGGEWRNNPRKLRELGLV